MSVLSALNNRKVLGIDASTQTLAFCLFYDGRPQEWGEIQYDHNKDLFVRLGSIEQRSSVIAERFSDVDYVLIEAPVKINNIRIAISLAYSYGIVAAKFASRGIRVRDVPPVTWQRYIGNKPFSREEKLKLRTQRPGMSKSWYSTQERKLRKQRTIDWVQQTFGITVESDNVGDAIAVAYYASKGKA
jgi:Holliday junction resolvasome RuvABC endonuclease subunit